MPRFPYEIILAGGGPAGSACAAAILRRRPDLAGRVLILERACHPRDKPCGGGLTGHVPKALERLGLRLDVPAVPSPSAQVVCGTLVRRVAMPQPVHIVRRPELDHSLLKQAVALGAELRQDAPLRDFVVEDGGVTVLAGTGPPLRARALVGAEGAGSLVRKRLGGHRGRPIRLFRAELLADSPYGDHMVYDFTPMQQGLRGYLWVFPAPGGRINVGVMHHPGPAAGLSGAALSALCVQQLRRHGIHVPPGALRGWPAWGYDPGMPLSAPHLCLVGDAAGIDALTGEGIAVALEQGELAAGALCEALRKGDLSLSGYSRLLRRAPVGRELALDRILARLLYGSGSAGGWHRWLSLLLLDEELLELYAQRVAGTLVLADQRGRLLRALLRHLPRAGARRAQLQAALSAAGPP
ncbi:MAG: NAD(P)/FAD-dependent oxidoreductase [Myxococcota bacterium]|nr:NAD(P)/FAD-dependent oxidoreductase [Myxococcota bacterium]